MSLTLLIVVVTTLLLLHTTAAAGPGLDRGNVEGTCKKLVHILPGLVHLPSSANYSSLANENWLVETSSSFHQLHGLNCRHYLRWMLTPRNKGLPRLRPTPHASYCPTLPRTSNRSSSFSWASRSSLLFDRGVIVPHLWLLTSTTVY